MKIFLFTLGSMMLVMSLILHATSKAKPAADFVTEPVLTVGTIVGVPEDWTFTTSEEYEKEMAELRRKHKIDHARRGGTAISVRLLNDGTNLALVVWDYQSQRMGWGRKTDGCHIYRLKIPITARNTSLSFYENGEWEQWPTNRVELIEGNIWYNDTNWMVTPVDETKEWQEPPTDRWYGSGIMSDKAFKRERR